MTIEENLQELLENFDLFDNWLDKYQYIIDLGKDLPDFPHEFLIDDNLVEGCQSRVWLVITNNKDTIKFVATSDSAIVRGLIAILDLLYNHASIEDLRHVNAKADFEKLGLNKHLSLSRKNGLYAMVNKIFDAIK